MPTAKIYHNQELASYEIHLKSFNFNRDIAPIVNYIKAAIPSSDREYNPITKNWTVLEAHWPMIEQLLKALNYHFQWETKAAKQNEQEYRQNFFYEQTASTGVNTESASDIAQKLGQYLGVEITTQQIQDLKRLYRMKARELHPDLGGDAKQMSELNRLWTLYENGVPL